MHLTRHVEFFRGKPNGIGVRRTAIRELHKYAVQSGNRHVGVDALLGNTWRSDGSNRACVTCSPSLEPIPDSPSSSCTLAADDFTKLKQLDHHWAGSNRERPTAR